MSTLADLLHDRTALTLADVDWLHRLVAEWQLVSDLSFADLVLWVRTREGDWLAAAHMRPDDRPDGLPRRRRGHRAVRRGGPPAGAGRSGARGCCGAGQPGSTGARALAPGDRAGAPRRRRSSPCCRGTRTLAAGRTPSPLELAYLSSAGELLQMVSEGTFPYPGHGDRPRVRAAGRRRAAAPGPHRPRRLRQPQRAVGLPAPRGRRATCSARTSGTRSRTCPPARGSTSRAARRRWRPRCASGSRASPRSRRRAPRCCCAPCRCCPAVSRGARWCWCATSPSCAAGTARSSARTRRSARSTTA